MQVTIHSIDRAVVTDYTEDDSRKYDGPPFVNVELIDGKGSTVHMLLRDTQSAYRLYEAAREAMETLGIALAAS